MKSLTLLIGLLMATDARLTQAAVEVARTGDPEGRVTQAAAEALYAIDGGDAKLTQAAAEALYAAELDARVTQTVVEVLYVPKQPPLVGWPVGGSLTGGPGGPIAPPVPCVRYRVTYQTWNIRTCELVTQWTEIVCCRLAALTRGTLHSDDCTTDAATGGLSSSCCGEAAGGGDGYVVEYTTMNFATCEVTGQECLPLEDCTYCDPDPIDSGLFPTTMYVVTSTVGVWPDPPPFDDGSPALAYLQWPAIEIDYNPTPITPIGDFDWYGGISPTYGHRYCFIAVFAMSVGGSPAAYPLECSILYIGAYPEPTLPCTEDNFSGGGSPFAVNPGAYLTFPPDPLYVEFGNLDPMPGGSGLRVCTQVMADAAGLSTPPRKLSSCPARAVPLPASLTFTAPAGAEAGTHALTYSDGIYRGGGGDGAFVLGGDYAEGPTGTIVVRWHKPSVAFPGFFVVYDFLASEIVSCDPLLIVNAAGATVTE